MFLRVLLFLSALLIFIGCDSESSTEVSQASIQGTVQFLDGSAAANAEIRLIVVQSNQNKFTNTDNSGNYSFEDLSDGIYEVSFISPSYEVNSYRSSEITLSGNNVEHNFFITYGILDELKTQIVSDSVLLVQYQPEGAKIGNNYSAVKNMSGYYRPASGSKITLECDVYEMPQNLSWNDADSLTPTYVKANFTYVMSLSESTTNFFHSVELSGESIPKILSNPANGFVFIKTTYDDKVLKVPCVDFNNNDFGLVIEYN
jgi:hypothetical protein